MLEDFSFLQLLTLALLSRWSKNTDMVGTKLANHYHFAKIIATWWLVIVPPLEMSHGTGKEK